MKSFKNVFNPLRIISIVFFTLLFLFIAVFIYLMFGSVEQNSEINFGVTFSQVSAEEMDIDWQEAYISILDDLGVKKLRLIAYWQKIEPNKGEYSFNDLDWQINEAKKRGAEVVLAVGSKLPGYSECYIPEWSKELNEEEKQESALLFLKEVINHYSSEEIIKSWQIEDNPFQKISQECVKIDKEFLNKEISLVKELDFARKPVMLTVSGELNNWFRPALISDDLGISVYRNNWTQYWGYFKYPIKPIFYKKMASLVKFFTEIDNIVIIELQAEPKGSKLISEMSFVEWNRSMDLDKFKDTVDYVSKTGFDEVYFKGAEWWYYLKGEGSNSFWSEAKKLWSE